MPGPDWIAVDWGSTHLRAWTMGEGGPLGALSSDAGMAGLPAEGFEPALVDLLADVLPESGTLPVICCGMVGARQGWREAPYVAAPCAPPGPGDAVHVKAAGGRLDVAILPGVRQESPPDVMRGEETQIAGFLAARPGFDGVLCLPGTHTKWVRLSAGEIVSFQTCMTGEMFALLAGKSVLRHSVAAEGWDDAAFAAAVDEAVSRPEALASRLFGLRAGALLAGLDAAVARARLSGLLIGAELAATKPYWLGQEVAILGAGGIGSAYRAGLAVLGAEAGTADAEGLTLAGLIAARAQMKETP